MDNIIIEIKPLEWKAYTQDHYEAKTINGWWYRIVVGIHDDCTPDYNNCYPYYDTSEDEHSLSKDAVSLTQAKSICQDDHVRMVMDVLNDFVVIKTKEE